MTTRRRCWTIGLLSSARDTTSSARSSSRLACRARKSQILFTKRQPHCPLHSGYCYVQRYEIITISFSLQLPPPWNNRFRYLRPAQALLDAIESLPVSGRPSQDQFPSKHPARIRTNLREGGSEALPAESSAVAFHWRTPSKCIDGKARTLATA